MSIIIACGWLGFLQALIKGRLNHAQCTGGFPDWWQGLLGIRRDPSASLIQTERRGRARRQREAPGECEPGPSWSLPCLFGLFSFFSLLAPNPHSSQRGRDVIKTIHPLHHLFIHSCIHSAKICRAPVTRWALFWKWGTAGSEAKGLSLWNLNSGEAGSKQTQCPPLSGGLRSQALTGRLEPRTPPSLVCTMFFPPGTHLWESLIYKLGTEESDNNNP